MIKDFLYSIKVGLTDAKNMLQEHNFKPFLMPLIVVLVLWFGLHHLNKSAAGRVSEVTRRNEAQKATITNEAAYKTAKAVYEQAIKRLPPADKKNEWLLAEMISIFERNNITPSKTGKHNLEESGIITMSSVSYDLEADFHSLGKLIESIESSEQFIRISELTVARAESNLGRLKVSLRVNTIFLNEKPAGPVAGKGRS